MRKSKVLAATIVKIAREGATCKEAKITGDPHMNYSSDAPPTLYSGYITNSLTPVNNFQRPDRKDVSDDPFLGFAPDFGDGMKLDEMDSWIHRVQNDFVFQQESIGKQAKPFSTW